MKAIPVPVRERIVKLYDQGQGTTEIAASFGYCVAAVRRVRQHFTERGPLKPQTHRCDRKTHLTQSRKERRLRLLERRPEATLAELGAQLERSTSTMDLWLARLGWSCKKNAARRRAVAARRGGAKQAMAATAGGRDRRPAGVRGGKRGPYADDPPLRAQPQRPAAGLSGAARALPDDPADCGRAAEGTAGPGAVWWSDGRGVVSGLGEAGVGPLPVTRRRGGPGQSGHAQGGGGGGRPSRPPERDWSICRRIRRTSTRLSRCGARSSRG